MPPLTTLTPTSCTEDANSHANAPPSASSGARQAWSAQQAKKFLISADSKFSSAQERALWNWMR
jgi:hypothetical protein